jgi:Rod binding domain-containing protein
MDAIPGLPPAFVTVLPLATPAPGKGQKAAREFEAQLIGTVLESLEKTFAALPGENAMAGEDDYNYLGTQALATALSAGRGFGIARMIEAHFESMKPEEVKAEATKPETTKLDTPSPAVGAQPEATPQSLKLR